MLYVSFEGLRIFRCEIVIECNEMILIIPLGKKMETRLNNNYARLLLCIWSTKRIEKPFCIFSQLLHFNLFVETDGGTSVV